MAARRGFEPSQEYVKSRLSYDPATGIFIWKNKVGSDAPTRGWNTKYAGKKAGCKIHHGYWIIGLDDTPWLAHVLAWIYVHGNGLPEQIDHRDGDTSNNRISNLRAATRELNQQNRSITKSSGSGYTGVYLDVRRQKWVAHAKLNGQAKYLGQYETKEEAAVAAQNWRKIKFPGHTGRSG